MKKVQVLIKKPGEPAEIKKIDHELQTLQSIVGGYIEVVYGDNNTLFIVNEEGRPLHLKPNIHLGGLSLVGTIVIAKMKIVNGEQDWSSLSNEEAHSLKQICDRASV